MISRSAADQARRSALHGAVTDSPRKYARTRRVLDQASWSPDLTARLDG